ncbi:MAG: hypothetical protein ACPG4Z_07280 [Chitinophagales bacterium]
MNRREFIKIGSISVIAISTFGCAVAKNESEFVGDCATTTDILGPFYRANAPVTQDLTFDGQVGTQVTIVGKVYTDDCETPLSDVKVEIWHADDEGEYDNNSNDFLQRAQWTTITNGEYQFKTIVPGRYLNGAQFRPHHFHFRVTHDTHKELVSQIYIQGDPYIENDPWAGAENAEKRILAMTEDENQNNTIHFDIHLEKKS